MALFDLGRFALSTGYTLPDAKLSYDTQGSLNAAKDNAVLFPNFLGGTLAALQIWVGEGRPLDPRRYFIIFPGHFGDGFSSSPSNTAPPFDRGAFPPVNIADDVIAQQRLLTEVFGIEGLQLVLGWSVGALQTYEWAVRFSRMVKRVASIAGAPKPSPWTKLWLRTVLEEPLTSDPGWDGGFYTDPRAVHAGLRRMGHGAALTLPPPGFFREGDEGWRPLGFASPDDFVSAVWEAYWLVHDPNDLLTQIRKTHAADASGGGDMTTALQRITAQTYVVAFTGDPMYPPEECKRDADRIPNAKFQEISGVSGHLATFALTQRDREAIDGVLAELLAD